MTFKWYEFKNYRLRTKLIISYMILTVIPVAILGYILYSQYTSSIEEQVGEYLPLVLEQSSEDIENQMKSFQQINEMLYNSPQVIEILRKDKYANTSELLKDQFQVNSYLSKSYIKGGKEGVLGVFIVSHNRLFQSTRISYTSFDFYENLPYGQEINLNGQTKMILPNETSLSFEGNPPYILIMKDLIDVDNRKKIGNIFLAVDIQFIKDIVEKLENKNQSDIWITDEHNRMIYHTNPKKIGSTFKDKLKYPLINGSIRTTSHNQNYLISMQRLDSVNWTIFHRVKVSVLTEKTDMARNATIILFVVFVLISTILSVILAWNVANPLHKLTKIMKKVEQGDFQADITIRSQDEIGLLAKNFQSMVLKIKELIREKYQLELKHKEAELYALQSQINPHFMYNTLETIGMAVESNDNKTVVKMVTILGRMLRYSISNKASFVPISQEILHMKDFLTIQKIRFEERLEFFIEETMESKVYTTPKFILQPIIENSIKYGLEQEEKLIMEIYIYYKDHEKKEIIYHIKDNGPGIKKDDLHKIMQTLDGNPSEKRASGFGLVNVHGRLQMAYGKQYGIQIKSEENQGTEIIINIPTLKIDET
ncbi:cache domain-containing sensor histidine kinase [Niallia nealsonii]|nr:sensor histidine kinase [Niallia nealsonii]